MYMYRMQLMIERAYVVCDSGWMEAPAPQLQLLSARRFMPHWCLY